MCEHHGCRCHHGRYHHGHHSGGHHGRRHGHRCCSCCECRCGCGCGCGSSGEAEGIAFQRRFTNREERISRLETYLEDLLAEARAVEERLAGMKRTE